MAYACKYKIVPGLKGYWVYEADDRGEWCQLGEPFKNRTEAEVAILRMATEKPSFYNENGEEV